MTTRRACRPAHFAEIPNHPSTPSTPGRPSPAPGLTLEQVGQRLGRNRQRVTQVERSALAKIRRELEPVARELGLVA